MIIQLLFLLTSCVEENKEKDPFFSLIKKGNWTILDSFLKENQGSLDFTRLNSDGKTAAHLAVETNDPKIVTLFFSCGIPFTIPSEDGSFPCQYAQEPVKKRLAAELGSQLREAVADGDKELTALLIKAGADVNDSSDKETPLFIALNESQLDIVKLLVEAGADIQARDANDGSLLHGALKYGDWDLKDFSSLAYLLSLGPDVNVRDKNGRTPLFYAYSPEAVKMLLEAGAQADIADTRGITPLHLLAFDKNSSSIPLLIAANSKVNARDAEGNTPLHYCGDEFNREGKALSLLLSYGADIHAVNNYGITPLHTAASGVSIDGNTYQECLHSDVNEKGVELLIKAGAWVNSRDKEGRTPLHFAVEAESFLASKLLIAAGADVNARSYAGITPFTMAKSLGLSSILKLMGR